VREDDDVTILSLDARGGAKLYLLQRDVGLDALGRAYALGGEPPDDAVRFAQALLAGAASQPRWWLTAHAFTDGGVRCRSAVHLGLLRDAVPGNVVHDRLLAYAQSLAIDATPYERCRDSLPEGVRAHHFVTFQRVGGRPRVTVYFSPPIRAPQASGGLRARAP
jgi:hypothetical protein